MPMDAMDALDRTAFAQVWSRVDARGTGPVAALAPAETGPEEGEVLRELVCACLAAAGAYRALARQSRRHGPALARLAREKTTQARRLAAAWLLASGVEHRPRVPAPAPSGPLFAGLRERFLAEEALQKALEDLAARGTGREGLYTALAAEAARAAERLRAMVETAV